MIGYTLSGVFLASFAVALTGAVFGVPVLYEAGRAVALVAGVAGCVAVLRAARWA